MSRLNSERGGAYLLQIALIAIVLSVVGVVVYLSVQTQAINTPASSSLSTVSSTVEWQTYTDEHITFKYPQGWKATKQFSFTDAYGAYSVAVSAPVDNNLVAADAANQNLYLAANIIIAKDGRFTGDCAGCGKVYSSEPVETNDTEGYLLIAESGVPDQPAAISLVNENVGAGAAGYMPTGVRVGTNYNLRVDGDYRSGDLSNVGFKNVNDIKNSRQYTQLQELVKSITVNSASLPR